MADRSDVRYYVEVEGTVQPPGPVYLFGPNECTHKDVVPSRSDLTEDNALSDLLQGIPMGTRVRVRVEVLWENQTP
jgi:hypothetical protein